MDIPWWWPDQGTASRADSKSTWMIVSLGCALWDAVWNAGSKYNIAPGGPNLIERVEGGLLSYGNEMTPGKTIHWSAGLDRFCTLDGSVEFIGRGRSC